MEIWQEAVAGILLCVVSIILLVIFLPLAKKIIKRLYHNFKMNDPKRREKKNEFYR